MLQSISAVLNENEVIEAIIGRGILRVSIIDPGLGVCKLRIGDPGWGPGLDIPQTEVLKDKKFKKGVSTSELRASIHWVLSGAALIMTEREI